MVTSLVQLFAFGAELRNAGQNCRIAWRIGFQLFVNLCHIHRTVHGPKGHADNGGCEGEQDAAHDLDLLSDWLPQYRSDRRAVSAIGYKVGPVKESRIVIVQLLGYDTAYFAS